MSLLPSAVGVYSTSKLNIKAQMCGVPSGLEILSAVADIQDSKRSLPAHGQIEPLENSLKSKKEGTNMRVGRWNPEEEKYTGRIIDEFKAGTLPLKVPYIVV